MAVKLHRTNFRVEVEPDMRWYSGDMDKKAKQRCAEIEDQIRRHVDGVCYVNTVHDVERVCEFCGSPWLGDGDLFNEYCCDDDTAAQDAREAGKEREK